MCDKTEVVSCVVATPLGNYEIRACSKGVHGIFHLKHALDPSLIVEEKEVVTANADPCPVTTSKPQGFKRSTLSSQSGEKEIILDRCKSWLLNYFNKSSENCAQYLQESPAICLDSSRSTDFERLVWKTLKDATAIGETISYGELANLIPKPKAARAVGTALKKNPIAILVPCHRVIRSNGSLGNYSGGTRNEVKKWLYDHEQDLKSKIN